MDAVERLARFAASGWDTGALLRRFPAEYVDQEIGGGGACTSYFATKRPDREA